MDINVVFTLNDGSIIKFSSLEANDGLELLNIKHSGSMTGAEAAISLFGDFERLSLLRSQNSVAAILAVDEKPILRGVLAKIIDRDDGKLTITIEGLVLSYFRHEIGQLYSPLCRAELGDSRCAIHLSQFERLATISTIDLNAGTISLDYDLGKPINYYSGGKMTKEAQTWYISFSYGAILALSNLDATMFSIGDSVTISPGCDKQFSTCKAKFNNAINFRGEPDIPGDEFLLTL